jgi:hypothetical protein
MTPQEIQERNKEIALMLGGIYSKAAEAWGFGNSRVEKKTIIIEGQSYKSLVWAERFEKELLFHSDWNWLMEAVEFINKTHNNVKVNFDNEHRDLTYTIQYLIGGGYFPRAKEPSPKRLMHSINDLFLPVSDFAKLYNEKT